MDDIIGLPASNTQTLTIDDDVAVDPSPFSFFPSDDEAEERDVNDAFGDIDLLVNPQKAPKLGHSDDGHVSNDTDDDSDHGAAAGGNYFSSNMPSFFGGGAADADDDEHVPVPLMPREPAYSFPAADDASVSSGYSGRGGHHAPSLSYEELQKEKQKLLFEIERYKRKGMKSSRTFTMASNIDDIRVEHRRMKHERDLEASVKFQRRAMLAFVSGAEYLNTTFDPIGAKLDGWSENVMGELDNYDEIFEELHDKYNEKVKMAPELRLLMMLGGSAFMFHMSNSFFKGGFDINEVMRQNPDLMRQLAQASLNHGAQAHGIPQNDPMFNMMQQSVNMNTGGVNDADDIINELNGMGYDDPVPPPPPQRRQAPPRRKQQAPPEPKRRRRKKDASLDLDL